MHTSVRATATLFVALTLGACAPNTAWRRLNVADCKGEPHDCEARTNSAHTENFPNYAISYLEFSERGNLFDPAVRGEVLDSLREELDEPEGVLVVVFVHGWKHNAAPDDKNVIQFRKALALLSDSKLVDKRRIHGVYVGWRGLTVHDPFGLIENVTYWDRKTAADEIGKGGVTDLLLELEALTRTRRTSAGPESSSVDNLLMVVGHSFGGAVVLSSINDVLLDRIGAHLADRARNPYPTFGNGVILLNPAIEANAAFQLKDLSFRLGQVSHAYPKPPIAKPLHVLSSDGDSATHQFFPIGQRIGNLTWNHQQIPRKYDGLDFIFSEYKLDTTTVGNLERFRTGRLARTDTGDGPDGVETWSVASLCSQTKGADHDANSSPIPCTVHDPAAFISTSPRFIKDHNDVFNPKVLAFMATTVSESIYERSGVSFPECRKSETVFDFDLCFEHNLQSFYAKRIKMDKEEQDRKEKRRQRRKR